jgi:hypothetical protein
MKLRGRLLAVVLFLWCSMLFAQSNLDYWQNLLSQSNYPDNWQTRLHFEDRLRATPYDLRHFPMEIVDSPEKNISRVKYEFREIDLAHYILFVNQSESNYFFEEKSRYSVDLLGRGNWIIKRDMQTGEFIQAKIYLLEKDESSYIRIYAGEDRCFIDIYLKDKLLYYHVPLGLKFDQVVFSPMARVLALTSDSIKWEQIFARADYMEWRKMEQMAGEIASHLDEMDYLDDGVLDQWGNWSFITDGRAQEGTRGVNCSGFAKWVADGYYQNAPYRNGDSMLSLDELKHVPQQVWEQQHSWNVNFADRDPLFGLVWTRNISRLLWEGYTGLEGSYDQRDLRSVPFFQYRENLGYPLGDLEPLLYLAAVDEPGRIYWATVSTPFKPEGETETLWQYVHVFVAIPWFDRDGAFKYRLFESGTETSPENLVARYGEDSWVHFSSNVGWRGFEAVELP